MDEANAKLHINGLCPPPRLELLQFLPKIRMTREIRLMRLSTVLEAVEFATHLGFPTEVLSDRGAEFVGLKDFVSRHRRTAAYRPQQNTRLERKHRAIGNLFRASEISPLDAALLLNDDNVERLVGKKRPSVHDLHAGDFCLGYVPRTKRKKGADIWEGPYRFTAQLGDRTFELESEFVVDIDDLREFRYSDLCRCPKVAFSAFLAL